MVHLSPSLLSRGGSELSEELSCIGSALFGTSHGLSSEKLYDLLQERFFLPHKGSFRFAIPDNGGEISEEQELAYRALGVIDALKPEAREYDYCLVPGALFPLTCRAVFYLLEQVVSSGISFANLVFLGSDRPLLATELWQLKQIDAQQFKDKRPQSETGMLQFLWSNAETLLAGQGDPSVSRLAEALRHIHSTAQVDFVHCAAKTNAPHATTADAVQALMLKLGNASLEDSRILLASIQPFARYHLCVLLNHCSRAHIQPRCLHAIGPECVKGDLGIERMGNNLAKLLYEEREYFFLIAQE